MEGHRPAETARPVVPFHSRSRHSARRSVDRQFPAHADAIGRQSRWPQSASTTPRTELPATRSASSSPTPGETPPRLGLQPLHGWRHAVLCRHTPRESCAYRVRRTAQDRAWPPRPEASRPLLCSGPSTGSPHNALTKINRREGQKVTERKKGFRHVARVFLQGNGPGSGIADTGRKVVL